MKVYLVLAKVLVVSALLIISNNNLHLYDQEQRDLFLGKYHAWVSRLFDQGVELTGYVVNSHWLPSVEESTGVESGAKLIDTEKIQLLD